MTTLNTAIDVSTPILNYPVFLPPSIIIGVIVKISLKVSSNNGDISIVSDAASTGYKDNVILLV